MDSKYNRVYKHIRCIGIPEYLSTRGEGNSQSLIARARCGNIEENNKYLRKEEERKCRLCESELITLKHLVEDCTTVERPGHGIERILEGSTCKETVGWLRGVEKKLRK